MNTYKDIAKKEKDPLLANDFSGNHGKKQTLWQFEDNRPQTLLFRQQQKNTRSSWRVGDMATLQWMASNSSPVHHIARLQALGRDFPTRPSPIQRKESTSELPANLKSSIETLSGISMDDVRVHYNSPKPNQIQAHAYAQGSSIHLATGQKKHLAHEAWHIVQQKQGLVRPNRQIPGNLPVNDNPTLEQEADRMGQKALQKTTAPQAASSQLKVRKVPHLPDSRTIQAKVKIRGAAGQVDMATLFNQIKVRLNILKIMGQVIATKPPEVKDQLWGELPEGFSQDLLRLWLKEWHEEMPKDYEYTDDEGGLTKLVKDAIKYHLHKKFGWFTVGAAAYMTGDATGLSMAAAVDPRMTVKVLSGQKSVGEPHAPRFHQPDQALPGTFALAESQGKVRISNVDAKRGQVAGLGGTYDLYRNRYNQYTAPSLKPWNKETYWATESIGKHYATSKEVIRRMLLPVRTDQSAEEDRKIQAFKDGLGLNRQKCILIWQRRSGERGGAHKELDSHPEMLKRMALAIGSRFQDRAIVLIGDQTVTEEELRRLGVTNAIFSLHDYWNSPVAKRDGIFPTREHQNQFLLLLSEQNSAVSVGMRSGSLEASALLGIPTIYLDDLSNRAEGRMEFWAGKAAYKRAQVMTGGGQQKDVDRHEAEYSGPIPDYKRVATYHQLGAEAGRRFTFFSEALSVFDPDQLKREVLVQNGEARDDKRALEVIDLIKELHKIKLGDRNAGKYFEAEPHAYKAITKKLNPLLQDIRSGKARLSQKGHDELQQAIKTEEENSFLTRNELDQITYLINYLRPDAT